MRSVLDGFPTEDIVLEKQNGEVYENIKALVDKEKIYIDDASLPMEEGDHLIRTLGNGMKESYLVLDRGYFESFHGIGAHYQVSVEKMTTRNLNKQDKVQQIIYNLNGSNSRVNNDSTDNSINIINTNSDMLFDEIRKIANENIQDEDDKKEVRRLVGEMEANQGTQDFNSSYTRFINSIASHMTIFSPFIPALSQMIVG